MRGAAKSIALVRMAGAHAVRQRWTVACASSSRTQMMNHQHNHHDTQFLLQLPAWHVVLTTAREFHGDAARLRPSSSENHFDSTSIAPRVTKSETEAQLQATTERLLGDPIGSFAPETWWEAEDVLWSWTRKHTPESVDVCFRLLDRILKERNYHAARSWNFPSLWTEATPLNRVLNEWRVVWWENDIPFYTPEKVLTRAFEYAVEGSLPVNEKSFYLITEAVHRRGDQPDAPDFAEKALNFCLEMQDKGHEEYLPSTDFFNLVIQIWARSDRPEARSRIERLIGIMDDFKLPMQQKTYLFRMKAWAATKSVEGAEKAQVLLSHMCQEYLYNNDGNIRARPTALEFNECIQAWLSSQASDALNRAENLLHQFIEMRSLGDISNNESATVLMNSLIHWLGKQKQVQTTLKAQEIFEKMSGVDQRDNSSYAGIVQAWAYLGEAHRVDELIRRMQEESTDRKTGLRVDSVIWNAAITAWGNSKELDRIERAESILKMMNEGSPEVQPNTFTYNAFLKCLSGTKHDFPATKAETILLEMQKRALAGEHMLAPDMLTYSLVIRLWEKFGFADRAVAILNLMIEDYQRGNKHAKPDTQCFDHVLGAYAKSKREDKVESAIGVLQKMISLSKESELDVRPTAHSYSKVLLALSNTKDERKKAAQQAEHLLNEMRSRYAEGANAMKPNSFCYNAVMNAWARAGQPERANNILEQMCSDFAKGNEEAKPAVSSFNAIIKALAFSKQPDAGKKAEEIIERMNSLHESGLLDAGPNVISYTTVILCYGLSSDPQAPHRADEIYRRMKQLHQMGKLDAPSEVTLSTLRRAWTTSQAPERQVRAEEIKREIEKRFGRTRAR